MKNDARDPSRHPASSRGLEEILAATGLRFAPLQPEGLGIPFAGGRAGDLVVRAREVVGGSAAFLLALPPLPRRPKKALTLLLQSSGGSDYIKAAVFEGGRAALLSKVPMSVLTPPVAEGVIRGLAALGDLRGGDLTSRGTWQRAVVTCLDAQAQHIRLDAADAMISIPPMLEDAGIEVNLAPDGSLVGRIGVVEAGLEIVIRLTDRVVSLVALPDVTPSGDEEQFLAGLVALNAQVGVGKVALTEDGRVALLYEVPRLTPEQIPDVKDELTGMATAVAGLGRQA